MYVIFATHSFTFSIIRSDLEQEEALEAIFNEDKAAGRLPILCIANVHSSLFQVNLKLIDWSQTKMVPGHLVPLNGSPIDWSLWTNSPQPICSPWTNGP